MLSFESVLSLGTSADVLKGTVKGQQASHHFKYYEVRANCIVLLIVLSLWERGVFMAVLWPKCLLSLRSILRGCQSEAILGVLARLLGSVYPHNVKYTNKITSQRLLDQSQAGVYMGKTPHTPPFGPIRLPYPKGLNC